MATLSYFCGRRSTPNTWQPAHVDEIMRQRIERAKKNGVMLSAVYCK